MTTTYLHEVAVVAQVAAAQGSVVGRPVQDAEEEEGGGGGQARGGEEAAAARKGARLGARLLLRLLLHHGRSVLRLVVPSGEVGLFWLLCGSNVALRGRAAEGKGGGSRVDQSNQSNPQSISTRIDLKQVVGNERHSIKNNKSHEKLKPPTQQHHHKAA